MTGYPDLHHENSACAILHDPMKQQRPPTWVCLREALAMAAVAAPAVPTIAMASTAGE